jgi:integrase/recombinase XerD
MREEQPRLEEQTLQAFYQRSNSFETQRAYRRVTQEFLRHFYGRHPREVGSEQIRAWRDKLKAAGKKSATIAVKLAIVRSFYEFLRERGEVAANPATTQLVPPPAAAEGLRGRALQPEEVRKLLAGPNRAEVRGARDYALLLLLLRTGMRVSEACGLARDALVWSHGRWQLKAKVKGGRERRIPLPSEVKAALDEYLKLDRKRRTLQHTDGAQSALFQPLVNYRTLEFDKPLSTTQAWKIVRRWAEFTGLGKVSPHDLRRTAITRALDQGLSYRQVRMMSGHRSLEMVLRYDHHRESLELNAINFLDYQEEHADGRHAESRRDPL